MNIKQQTQNVANQGRYGDSMLLHVNPAEVKGLAQAMPITVNPQTGQPEAFLPFLAPVLGSMAGGALLTAGGAAGLALSPALAAGIGAGLATYAQTAAAATPRAATGPLTALKDTFTQGVDATGVADGSFAFDQGAKALASGLMSPSGMVAGTALGGRSIINSQELFEEQMRQLEMDEEQRKRDMYANNPEVQLYTAAGGLTQFNGGGDTDNDQYGYESGKQVYAPAKAQYDLNPNFMAGFAPETMYFRPDSINAPATSTRGGSTPTLGVDTYTGTKGGYDYEGSYDAEGNFTPGTAQGVQFAPQTAIDPYAAYTGSAPQGLIQSEYNPNIDLFAEKFAANEAAQALKSAQADNLILPDQILGIDSYIDYLDFNKNSLPQFPIDFTRYNEFEMGSPSENQRYEADTLLSPVNINLSPNPFLDLPISQPDIFDIQRLPVESSPVAPLIDSSFGTPAPYFYQFEPESITKINRQTGGDTNVEVDKLPENLQKMYNSGPKGKEGVQKIAAKTDKFDNGGDTEMKSVPVNDFRKDPMTQQVIAFLMGDSDNTKIVDMFVDKYGNETFMALREMVLNPDGTKQTEGLIAGMGNSGMADDLLGSIGNKEKIAVSQDEFIVPADVVSGLGDGSSDAGSKELYAMMDRVRQKRTGTTKQPAMLANAGGLLPA